jgi:hypothetical protein
VLRVIRINDVGLAIDLLDMRADFYTTLVGVVTVFGAVYPLTVFISLPIGESTV